MDKHIIYYNPILKERARELRRNQTFVEINLWYALRNKQLAGYDFHRQKPIGNYIYDFYSYKLKLVIEVDGITHDEPDTQENDRNKDEYIKSIGFNILRFTDDEVLGNCDKVVGRICEYIRWFTAK